MKDLFPGFKIAIKLITIFILFIVYLLSLQLFINTAVGKPNDIQFLIGVIAVIYAIIIYIGIKKVFKEKIYTGNYARSIFNVKNMFIVVLSLSLVVLASFLVHSTTITTTRNQLEINKLLTVIPTFIVMQGCIVAPIVEEVFFRKSIFNIISPTNNIYVNNTLAIISSSILFCMVHTPTTTSAFILYGFSGLVLSLSYVLGNGLATSLPIHIMINIISLLTI